MNRSKQVLFLAILILVFGCAGKRSVQKSKDFSSGYYSAGPPAWNASADIGQIARSVKKLYSISSYTTWQFKRETGITGYHLQNNLYQKYALGIVSTNETAFGTATVIMQSDSRIAVLTCAHVVKAPDTLITYFEPIDQDPSRYIQSISIKEKQENYIRDFSLCGSFNVLESDPESDIAILGKNCEIKTDTISPLAAPVGLARELGWGCYAYILGYPLGNQTITQGLTSPLPKRPMGEFTVDALLNKGFSGGIILAVRNDPWGFELVGMVSNVGSSREDFLKPSGNRHASLDWLPYTGELFVGKSDIVQYGINTIIPIDQIRLFYQKNRSDLIKTGYNLDTFFNFSPD
jgi:hypothetical protein